MHCLTVAAWVTCRNHLGKNMAFTVISLLTNFRYLGVLLPGHHIFLSCMYNTVCWYVKYRPAVKAYHISFCTTRIFNCQPIYRIISVSSTSLTITITTHIHSYLSTGTYTFFIPPSIHTHRHHNHPHQCSVRCMLCVNQLLLAYLLHLVAST